MDSGQGIRVEPPNLNPRLIAARPFMRLLMLSLFAATAAIVLAGGDGASSQEPAAPLVVQPKQGGELPAGPLFRELSPDEVAGSPVTVPEPVWASVLAAMAVIVLRRTRH
jgi:hypothetical protein